MVFTLCSALPLIACSSHFQAIPSRNQSHLNSHLTALIAYSFHPLTPHFAYFTKTHNPTQTAVFLPLLTKLIIIANQMAKVSAPPVTLNTSQPRHSTVPAKIPALLALEVNRGASSSCLQLPVMKN